MSAAVLALRAFAVVVGLVALSACTFASTKHRDHGLAPPSPTGVAQPAGGGDAAEVAAARASVSLIGFTCPVDDAAVMRERERWGVYVDAIARTAGGGGCEGTATSLLVVDELGRLAPAQRSWKSLFPESMRDGMDGSWRVAGNEWAALLTRRPYHHVDFTFVTRSPDAGHVVAVIRRPPGDALAGIGPWPGGAVIAAFGAFGGGSPASVEVVSGAPSAPLPSIGPVGGGFDFASTPDGEAFGIWRLDRMDGGLVALHWRRGEREPAAQVLSRVDLGTEARKMVVVSSDEVYLPVVSGVEGQHFARILRFDGLRWTTSLHVDKGEEVVTLAAGPDGGMWALVSVSGPVAPGSVGSELWRQVPGRKDAWHRVAVADLGLGTPLRATSLLPFRGGALFAGRLNNRWLGLYRIDISAAVR